MIAKLIVLFDLTWLIRLRVLDLLAAGRHRQSESVWLVGHDFLFLYD